ncbi:MAG TPA: fatty acyl-AMP ligase, partial [Chloroflexota bacterium]
MHAIRSLGGDQSARLAFAAVNDGTQIARRLSHGELDARARAIAAFLQQRASPGDRVLLPIRPPLDFVCAFLGCLYARCVAVPTPMPHRRAPVDRFQHIVADCQPSLVLASTSSLVEDIRTSLADARVACEALEAIPDDAGSAWRDEPARPEDLAYLQYTSGSTSQPRGVMVSHGNLLANLHSQQRCHQVTDASVMVTWLPVFHDLGLVYGLLLPLSAGGTCYAMTPEQFVRRPANWLRAISQFAGTHSAAPNFAYDLCVDTIQDEALAGVDVTSWRVALNGAEPVRARTVERFADRFAAVGFRGETLAPGYGLAEVTLTASLARPPEGPRFLTLDAGALETGKVVEAAEDDARKVASCGAWDPDSADVVIVDPRTLTPCPDGQVGSIWLSGPSVAQGYWQQPADTVETFHATLADDRRTYLQTGDLGFIHHGQLFVTGRQKDVIIIRGRNLYPQDLELTAEGAHAALRPNRGAAFGVETPAGEALALVHEVRRGTSADEAQQAIGNIRLALAREHEVEARHIVLIQAGALPVTSSGKIQRGAARQAFLEG